MLTVFVWDMSPSDPAGHASMYIRKREGGGKGTYISWWPEHFRNDVGLGGVRGGGVLAWGGAAYANTMREDKKFKQRLPDYASAPIKCLDEDAILTWWNEIRPKNNQCRMSYSEQDNTHYDLARMSCATIVMRALLKGGAGNIAEPGIPVVATAAKGLLGAVFGVVGSVLGEMTVGNAISPLDVKRYARVIAGSQGNRDG